MTGHSSWRRDRRRGQEEPPGHGAWGEAVWERCEGGQPAALGGLRHNGTAEVWKGEGQCGTLTTGRGSWAQSGYAECGG